MFSLAKLFRTAPNRPCYKALMDTTDRARADEVMRENALQWALHTANVGEDPMLILARAQLYEEYLLGAAGTGRGLPHHVADAANRAANLR